MELKGQPEKSHLKPFKLNFQVSASNSVDSTTSGDSKYSDLGGKRTQKPVSRKNDKGHEGNSQEGPANYCAGKSQVGGRRDGGEITSGQTGKRCTVSISEAAGDVPVSSEEPDETQVGFKFKTLLDLLIHALSVPRKWKNVGYT